MAPPDPMDEEYQRLLAVFRGEANEVLDALVEAVEMLPEQGGAGLQDSLQTCMRHAHNIKGASAIVELEQMERLAHSLEDALIVLSQAEQPPTQSQIEPLVQCIVIMQRLAEDEAGDEDVEPVIELLETFGEQSPMGSEGGSRSADLATAADELEASDEQGLPEQQEPGPAEQGTDRQVEGGTFAQQQASAVIEGDAAGRSAPVKQGPEAGTIRVETARLDRLMGFAGELLVAEARLAARASRLERLYEALREHVGQLDEHVRHEGWAEMVQSLSEQVLADRTEGFVFGNLVSDLGAAMRSLRMQPVANAAPAWRRAVREASRSLGKPTRLVLDLGEVEIDRSVLDRIREPIMHLLRNAIDHGIEPSDERERAGKPAVGTIRIVCTAVGSNVRLTLSDDGRGIELERLLQAAVGKGLLSRDEAERLTENEILELLFHSGVSSAAQVGQISGRGVGLDVVRNALLSIGGHVRVSPFGEMGGASFDLSLPASLLSSQGLLVRTGRAIFVLPLESVQRTVRVQRESLVQVGGRPSLVLDDSEPIAVHDLRDLMGLGGSSNDDQLSILVMELGTRQIGVVVEEVIRAEEHVVKQLPWNLRKAGGLNGAVIMADGSLALAIDPAHLLQVARPDAGRSGHASPRQPRRGARVLVADDSLTSRTLERTALVAAGYEVEVAVDGLDAWQQLEAKEFDLLVSDVEMPGLDGYELTRRVRGSERLGALPVVLVTRLAGAEDIACGAAAGADAHIVKGRLERDKLIETVARLLEAGGSDQGSHSR